MRYPERIDLKTTPALRERLRDVAASQHRSVNNLINVLLWDAVWGPLPAPVHPLAELAAAGIVTADPTDERRADAPEGDNGHTN